jgi:copper transport protein
MRVRERMPPARRVRISLLAAALAAAAVLFVPARVSAHTNFIGSDPPDSAALSHSPQTVSLDFDKKVAASLASITLVDAEGRSHPVISVAVAADRNTQLTVNLPQLPRDTYRLSYTIRDSVDLHVLTGSVVFGIGSAPTLGSQSPAVAQTRSVEVALRWLALFGLCLAAGAVLVRAVVQTRIGDSAVGTLLRRQLLFVGIAGVALQLDAQVFLLISQAFDIGSAAGLGTILTQSDFGVRWMLGTAVTLCLLGVLLLSLRERSYGAAHRRPARLRALLHGDGLAAALIVTSGLIEGVSGHSGDDASPTVSGTLLRGAHIVSVAAWMGGLCVLVFVVVQLRRLGPGVVPRGTARAVAAGFSLWAGPLFGMIVATGLVLAGVQVASVTALLSTAYGAALIVKVGLVLVVALLALRHTRLLHTVEANGVQRPWSQRARISLPLEAAGAALILLIASLLTSSPPPRGPEYQPTAEAAPSAVAVTAKDLVVRVELRPNRPGRNLLTVAVLNTRRPIPGPVRGVTVQLQRPGSTTPQRVATAPTLQAETYDGGAVDLNSSGELGINVVVTREGLPVLTATVPWRVNPNQPPPHATVVSTQSIAPITNTAAVLVAIAGGLLVWRRRRSARAGDQRTDRDAEAVCATTDRPAAPLFAFLTADDEGDVPSEEPAAALRGANMRE